MAIEPSERLDCNNSALFCYGTAHILEQRLISLRVAVRLLNFSSLAGPIAIGAVIAALGADGSVARQTIFLAALLSIAQVMITLWAVIADWQGKLLRYEQSLVENQLLTKEYTDLANRTSLADSRWRSEKEVLETKGEHQLRKDLQEQFTEEEKRMGMRYSLRYFQRACVHCLIVPNSIESTDCPVCGQFKRRRLKWLW